MDPKPEPRKLNGGFKLAMQIVVWLVIASASGATAWALMSGRVANNETKIESACGTLVKHDERIRKVEDAQAEQRADYRWIKESLERIEKRVR